jgi:glycosyltransferase involved in cell wall biosynthesis
MSTVGLKPNDLVLLQATRISARKGIELAIDFVSEFAKQKDRLVGKALYNGKQITSDSQIVLLLAGYAEKDSQAYQKKLQAKIKLAGIKALFIADRVDAQRRQEEGKKIYSLWDAYVYADLVTFPSWWEGWGNQLLEAVFAKKPVVVFEYPVFKADIVKEGYRVISLGDQLNKTKADLVTVPKTKIRQAVDQAAISLTDPETSQLLDHNWQIGKRYHSGAILEGLLKKLL